MQTFGRGQRVELVNETGDVQAAGEVTDIELLQVPTGTGFSPEWQAAVRLDGTDWDNHFSFTRLRRERAA